MALDPLGGAEQRDTVVAIARDGDGRVRGFLHFVPSYGRPAMSLSFMRRDPETPNGLTEFLVARSIEAFPCARREEVSLNFAAFARLLTEPENLLERAAARVLRWADAWFQIESLYRFNAKFDPRWEPRYVLYEGRLGLARAGLAARGPKGSCRSHWPAGEPSRPRRAPPAAPTRCASASSCSRGRLVLPPWAMYLAIVLPRDHIAAELGRRLGRVRPRARCARRRHAVALRRRSSSTPVLGGGARGRAPLRRVVRRHHLDRRRPPLRRRARDATSSCRGHDRRARRRQVQTLDADVGLVRRPRRTRHRRPKRPE